MDFREKEWREGIMINREVIDQGRVDKLVKKVEKCREYMGLVFEDLDGCHKGYERVLESIEEEAEKITKKVYDKLEDKLGREMKQIGSGVKESGNKNEDQRSIGCDRNNENDKLNNKRSDQEGRFNIGIDIVLPKFDNKGDENPKRFLEEFDECVRVRGILSSWKLY